MNAIPGNPGPDPTLRPPKMERVERFVARLSSLGVTTLVRRPRGRDVGGACGQLAGALEELGLSADDQRQAALRCSAATLSAARARPLAASAASYAAFFAPQVPPPAMHCA